MAVVNTHNICIYQQHQVTSTRCQDRHSRSPVFHSFICCGRSSASDTSASLVTFSGVSPHVCTQPSHLRLVPPRPCLPHPVTARLLFHFPFIIPPFSAPLLLAFVAHRSILLNLLSLNGVPTGFQARIPGTPAHAHCRLQRAEIDNRYRCSEELTVGSHSFWVAPSFS